MIELSEKKLFDYIKCPLRYDAEHNLKMVPPNHPTINSLLGHIGNAFLLALMNGNILPPSQLKRKWDRKCEEHQDIISQKSCLAGMSKLLSLYRWAEDKQLTISDMKFPYQLTFREEGIILDGEVAEAIVVNLKNPTKYELLMLDFNDRYPDQSILDMKLKLTLDWMGCCQQIKDFELTGIHIHHVKNNKDFYTFRTKEDMVRAKESILAIAKGIRNKVFYPRESVMCAQCDMKMYCRAWRGPMKE